MRTLTDDAALNGESRDEILDRLCDYAHAVMLL